MNGDGSGHDRPAYIAFRIAENGRLVAVVAVLEPDDGSRFPWALWYHELAAAGEFKKAPGDYLRLGIGEGTARTMIELVKVGRSLPSGFVAQLPIVE